MATNIPLTGEFEVTYPFGMKNKNYIAGFHTGIDLYCANLKVYSPCDGYIYQTGYDNSYGNYIVIREINDRFHWLCHLDSINVKQGNNVSRTKIVGIMGSTGNSTGTHLHYEIRKSCNCYGQVHNPAEYMGIPNERGLYNTSNYQIGETVENVVDNFAKGTLKTLAVSTYLREGATVSSNGTLYIPNTTLYIEEPNVANADGYIWDKVKIRVNGKVGYMARTKERYK